MFVHAYAFFLWRNVAALKIRNSNNEDNAIDWQYFIYIDLYRIYTKFTDKLKTKVYTKFTNKLKTKV